MRSRFGCGETLGIQLGISCNIGGGCFHESDGSGDRGGVEGLTSVEILMKDRAQLSDGVA